MSHKAIGKAQAEVGQRVDVDGDDAKLLGPIELDGAAKQAEAGIVDEILDLNACSSECFGDLAAGIGWLEIARDDDRRRTTSSLYLCRQSIQAVGPPRYQSYSITLGG